MNKATRVIGDRVLVIGISGSGKSTFSRALSARTGLPVLHLDLHYWKPGWVKPVESEWRDLQREILASERWIADGNWYESLDVQLERTQTLVTLATPWWICATRAFRRGLRTPGGEMPTGCVDSRKRRIHDEWGMVGRIWRGRLSQPALAHNMVAEHGAHAAQYVLRSKREVKEFLNGVSID